MRGRESQGVVRGREPHELQLSFVILVLRVGLSSLISSFNLRSS